MKNEGSRSLSARVCQGCGEPLPPGTPGSACWKCMMAAADQDQAAESPFAGQDGEESSSMRLPRPFGDYVLEAEIGHGGMGVVYRARQLGLDRLVAVKLLLLGAFSSQETIVRFRREARAAAGLRHPNIVTVYQVGEQDGHPYLAMEYVTGRNLAQLAAAERLSWRRAVECVLAVARAVQYAHEHGVLHRDIKPSNILIDESGAPRLTDFGLARRMGADRDLTATGRVLGTPNYLAPEAAAGLAAEVGPASDIYGLGAVFYELLTGQPPFPDTSLPEVLHAIREREPLLPRTLNPRLPREVEAVCLKCLEKDPRSRYASAGALAEDCQRLLDNRPPLARRPGLALRAKKWAQRNIGPVLLVSAALILASLGYAAFRAVQGQRDLARRWADLNAAVGEAELATRNGRWPEALRAWDRADASGYSDRVQLGLRRAEAFLVLGQAERAGEQLRQLVRRTDLGERRGLALLYLGDHELFHQADPGAGVAHVKEALKAGLPEADRAFAEGLLADSTPQALDCFRRTLRLAPFHRAAHRHSLGLEQMLGLHAELAEHLRVFRTIFPDDRSAVFIEASELALQGQGTAALTLLDQARVASDASALARFRTGLRLLAAASEYYDLDRWLAERPFAQAEFESLLADALPSSAAGGRLVLPPALSAVQIPDLPCLQTGLQDALTAVQSLAVPVWGDLDLTVERIKASWKRHPEALLPMFAATSLDVRHPKNGPRSLALLVLQADLFQLAADSSSLLPRLDRAARYRAAEVLSELAGRQATNSAAGPACLARIRQATAAGPLSVWESRHYFPMAFRLRDYGLSRRILQAWRQSQPEDPAALRAQVELEVAEEAFGAALRLLDARLASVPGDDWARVRRKSVVARLSEVLKAAQETTPPSP